MELQAEAEAAREAEAKRRAAEKAKRGLRGIGEGEQAAAKKGQEAAAKADDVYFDDLHLRLAAEDGHDFHQDGDGGVGVARTFTSFGKPHNPYRHGVPVEPWREEWRTTTATSLLGVPPGGSAEIYRTTTSHEVRLRCEDGVELRLG